MIKHQRQNWLKSDSLQLIQTNFFGDHNLGLYAKCSDKICLLGNFVSKKVEEKIASILSVEIVRTTLSGTDFAGIFSAMNSSGVVLPNITKKFEIDKLKTIFKSFDLNYAIVSSKFNCLGNLILCNDKGSVISKTFSKTDKKKIENILGVEAEFGTISGMNIVGSTAVATNRGCFIHRDASENEIEKIEEILKVKADIGTANFGSPFVGSCFFANSNGAVIGDSTTGAEIDRIYTSLGFK
jgi:translation initiation factor 6